jgi:hypothetical protein
MKSKVPIKYIYQQKNAHNNTIVEQIKAEEVENLWDPPLVYSNDCFVNNWFLTAKDSTERLTKTDEVAIRL